MTGKRGFTLIEMLVVMVVIALLLTIAVPRYFHSLERSREAVLRCGDGAGYARRDLGGAPSGDGAGSPAVGEGNDGDQAISGGGSRQELRAESAKH